MSRSRPLPTKTVPERLEAFRAEMRRAELWAYIVPSTDPHQSEYTPLYWQRRQWLSGFTGSVGDLVVTLDGAYLWTDSRYFLQAVEQLEGTSIELMRQGVPGVPTMIGWLGESLGRDTSVGVDPRLVTLEGLDKLERAVAKAGARLALLDRNLVDQIWRDDRPSPPGAALHLHPGCYAGEKRASKLERLRRDIEEREALAHVVSRLDDVAWLFNIRGEDVDFTPIAVAYGLVTKDRAMLFVDEQKVSSAVERGLAPDVEVRPYESIAEELRAMAQAELRVWVDPVAATAWIGSALEGADILRKSSTIPVAKARKNAREVRGAREAHRRDGLALMRFLAWLEGAVGRERVTEISAAEKLESFRAELPLYRGASFRTISAVGGHGAIVHYSPTPETDRRLRAKGLYLVDSGGQFLDGTTDVTRTVLLGGEPTDEQRDHFTRVLSGHIALTLTRFPAGVSGQRLDAIARRALWDAGLDYGHGTGHGVGSYLGVHESPPGVAPARLLSVPLEVGHVLSNEPGYYRAGRWGIRTENLVLVVRDAELSRKDRTFLKFETLTRCPIDTRLVEPSLLQPRELEWLNDYHASIREEYESQLDANEAAWLCRSTAPI